MFKMDEGCLGQCEMDTHADTYVAGGNLMACEFDGTTCEVTLFTDAYESMKDMPIVTAATAWANKESGETLILLFHQVCGMERSWRTVCGDSRSRPMSNQS
jgi:hypothetical protein